MADDRQERNTGMDSYRGWHSRVQAALRHRKQGDNGDISWRRGYDLFKGKHWALYNSDRDDISSDNARDLITVNITGSGVRGMLPFLVNKSPKILCRPRQLKYVVSAALKQEVLNYEWKERRMQRQLKRSVLDAVICGHGVAKTGYTIELDETKNPAVDGTIQFEDYIKKEASYIKRVSPFKFIFDPEASEHDLHTARWCSEIFFKTPYSVLNNKNYAQKVLGKIQSGQWSPGCIPSYEARELEGNVGGKVSFGDESNRELWLLYELWDKQFQKYYVFIDGIDTPVVEKAWPYDYLDGFPYVKMDFIHVPDEAYGYGLPRWVEDQQFELNRVRTRWFQHGRRFNRKYEVLKGMLSEAEKVLLQVGEDGTILEVEALGNIKAIDDARVSGDQSIIEAQIKQDFREITGQDELARGGNLPSRTTASEVDARTSLLTLKTDEYRASVDEFTDEIVTQTSQHVTANMQKKRVEKITGPRGQYWLEFSREDIQGEVDITIETTSAPKTNPEKEKAESLQVFQLIMQNLQTIMQAQVPLDIPELFKWILGKMDTGDAARFFKPLLIPNAPLAEGATPEETGPPAPQQASTFNPNLLLPGQDQAAQRGAAAGPSSAGVGV